MNLQLNDIIIKNTKEGETLWLSQHLVQQVCSLSDEYFKLSRNRYKKSVQACYHHLSFLPDSGKGWRWAKTDRGFFYCYDNIPDRNPTNYRSRFGTAEQIKAALNEVSGNIKSTLKEATKAEIKQAVRFLYNNEDYRYYQLQSPVGFSDQQAKELMKSLAWCRYISREYFSAGFKNLGIQKKQDFIQLCTELLEPLQLEGLKVKSPAYLRNKIAEFSPLTPEGGTMATDEQIRQQREFLISDKYDNINALKVGKAEIFDPETGEIFKFDAHEALMFNAYMNPGGTTKEAIWKLYNGFYVPGIQEFGLEPIAYRTFCHHLAMFHNQMRTAKARHGEDYYKKHFLTYIPSKKLQFSHSLFAGDGSGTVNYQYYNSAGKLSTMKLYVILISDVASRKIVGWAPSPKGQHKETPEMLEKAIKMAVENCSRMTMFEFVSDNHSAFTAGVSKDLLNNVFNKVRTIQVGNSQANPAEVEFRLFKRSLRDQLNFTASSWDAGIENQSNPVFFDVETLPTYEDAVIQVAELIERFNYSPQRDGITPDMRFSNRNPNCMPMDGRVLRKLFGFQTEKMIRGMRGFLQLEKTQGYEVREKFLFEIPDYETTGAEMLAKATNYVKEGKVKVIWDESNADIYTLDGKFVMTAPKARLASQAYIESDAENDGALSHNWARKTRQMNTADAFEDMLAEIATELPYSHAMAAGGSKESWNGGHEAIPPTPKGGAEAAKRKRADRDFEW